MSVTVYVPNDSAAIGIGANATAQAISRIAAERGSVLLHPLQGCDLVHQAVVA